MDRLTASSPYDIKIMKVLVESDRFPETYNIVRNVSEINIYEHLDMPFLTGTLLITDSSNLFSNVGFRGTERVKIVVKINGDDNAQEVEKNFIVSSVGGIAPSSDTSETISLNLIEDFGYLNSLTSVRKHYKGKPEQIIATVLKDNLGINVIVPNEFQGSSSKKINIIAPNISPLKTAMWIKNKMVSNLGMPFYLYSTLNGGLHLADLGYMLSRPSINKNKAYVYGQAFTRYTITKPVTEQARVIERYKLSNAENIFELINKGIVNAQYDFINSSSSSETNIKIDLDKLLKSIYDNFNIKGLSYNDFIINNKSISDYTSSTISQIISTNTYEDGGNYYEDTPGNLRARVFSRAIRYYFLKSPIEIIMPGFNYLGRGKDITLGRQILLHFLKNDPDVSEYSDTVLDERRSGNYIIYGCRHIFKSNQYSVSLSCCKFGDIDG